ncbi:MAG TPA: hypothetical protein VHU19_08175 [Pyrinomonadaceae bacterium]|jgi:hypothetical protein|nr:hypothetical protein [Pyrinomonadaceae bacterium]
MPRILTGALLAFICCLVAAGCGRGVETVGDHAAPPGDVDSVIGRVNSFTAELTGAVESAPDTKAGIAAGQKMLDSRKAELAASIAALKGDAKLRQDAAARRKWLEAEVDNTDRVSRLQVKYLDASMRDPDFKARLDRLVGDYNSMFKDAAPR